MQLNRWSFIRLSLLVGGGGKGGQKPGRIGGGGYGRHGRKGREVGILKIQETKEIGGITQQCLTFRNLKELTGGSQEKEAGVGDARYGRREVCPLSSSHNIRN